MLLKNTTTHEKRFPFQPEHPNDRHEIVFPAGGVVEVSDFEKEALENSRVAMAWAAAGELVEFTPGAEKRQARAALDSAGGAELDEKRDEGDDGTPPAGDVVAKQAPIDGAEVTSPEEKHE